MFRVEKLIVPLACAIACAAACEQMASPTRPAQTKSQAGNADFTGRQGLNDWKRTGYGGPCPPIGRHRYFFKLYALDTLLGEALGTPTKAQLLKAMGGHVLAETRLIGTYERGR